MGRIGILFERIFQCGNSRLVATDRVVGLSIDEDLVVLLLGQLADHLLESGTAGRVGIATEELLNCGQRLSCGGLVAHRLGREIVVAQCVHTLNIFEEGAAGVLAAEIVKELRAGCEIIALEVSISGVVSQRVLAHRTCEIGLYLLEAHNRTAILSHIEVVLTLGIYLIVVAAFEQLVERAATGAGNRSCEHDEQHRN